jgi:hypothetical protein
MPTNNSGGNGMAVVERRISLNTPGAILQPHPPPCERLVRRGLDGVAWVIVQSLVGPAQPQGITRSVVDYGKPDLEFVRFV